MTNLILRNLRAFWNKETSVAGFDDKRAVSLEANAGEWILVAGANGIGKSTLLHAVAGTANYISGLVLVGGVVLNQQRILDRFDEGVQFVPQQKRFAGRLRFADAVDLFRVTRPALFNERAIADLLERLRSVGLIDQEGYLLDRRFDIATAILAVPRVLLLDEIRPAWPVPDDSSCYETIRKLLPWSTVLLTEHELELGLGVADRILWLREDQDQMPTLFDKKQGDILAEFKRAQKRESAVERQLQGHRAASTGGWDASLRLDRSPKEQLRLAIQARGTCRNKNKAEERAFQDFNFLENDKPAEGLSGGQRTVLRWFLLEYSQIGGLPDEILAHLDRDNQRKINKWGLQDSPEKG